MGVDNATVLLVPGGWHGAWCWLKVVDELAERDVPARAIDLSSSGTVVNALGDMADDIEAVRNEIRAIEGPIVVVGHSYSGMVITGAAAGAPSVRHVVYVAAFMPDADETVTVGFSANSHAWSEEKDGARHVPRDVARDAFYHDCDADTQEWALDRLAPYASPNLRLQTPGAAAWREVDSTYVVCTEDRAMPVDAQWRQSKRAANVDQLASGHSPFLSQPAALAELLARVARGTVRDPSGTARA